MRVSNFHTAVSRSSDGVGCSYLVVLKYLWVHQNLWIWASNSVWASRYSDLKILEGALKSPKVSPIKKNRYNMKVVIWNRSWGGGTLNCFVRGLNMLRTIRTIFRGVNLSRISFPMVLKSSKSVQPFWSYSWRKISSHQIGSEKCGNNKGNA